MQEMNQLLSALLWGQLRSIGLLSEPEGTVVDLDGKKLVRDFYRKWFAASCDFLVEEQYLSRQNGTYRVIHSTPVDLESTWKAWEQQKVAWMRQPALKAQVVLVETMLRALPDILSGKKLATHALFPDASMELVEGIYKNNNVADYFNAVACSAISFFIEELLQQRPTARIRLLEVGAGSGGTSAFLLKKLRSLQDHIEEYCYTDISKAFLLYAEKEFGAEHAYLTYKIFNAERPVAEQACEPGAYDIVIASNVLHATKNIKHTLRNCKALLRKNGLLVLNEISNKALFSHLTFGLLEGWWLYEDRERRIPGCPGLYPEAWQEVLEEEGFRSVFFPAENAHHLGQQIIVAESDGNIQQLQLPQSRAMPLAQEQRVPAASGNHHSSQPFRNTTGGTLDSMLEEYVRQTLLKTMADVLKMDQALIDDETSFVDYGLDSILGMNFVSATANALTVPLQATDIFDYSSISRLARYIVSAYREHVVSALGTSVTSQDDYLPAQEPAVRSEILQVQDISSVGEADEATLKEPIAIIGMSGRFAGSQNVEELWKHLADGDDLVEKLSRWDLSGYYPRDAKYCDAGSFLDDIDKFDPLFFAISGLEATYMDPQQRIFLEEAWKALEDAGYTGPGIAGTRCGVYVGCATGDYKTLFAQDAPPQALWGSLNSAIAARISYHLDLQGPAITVDTACSSSLVALHLACQGLWTGEIAMALAGGIYIQTTPQYHLIADRAGMLSKTGHCYSFDNRADGMVPGEAAAVVVLKRLRDALADRDHIYGVIEGSGINQDGTTNGITAPSLKSQERLERSVYDQFQINPAEIQMVEAHGTGTRLGDPIEYHALSRAFRQYTEKQQYCAIGSLKTNLGHTQLASGVAGLIKVLLSLQHRQIPPSLHFISGNTNIQFTDSPFYVNTTLRNWDIEPGSQRRAAVSSFGATGTNAHLVVREAPRSVYRSPEKPGYLIVLSARTPDQLRQQAEQFIAFCQHEPAIDCASMSYTLLLGRKHLKHRLACVIRNQAELVSYLSAWVKQQPSPHIFASHIYEQEHRETFALKRYGNQCIQECRVISSSGAYLEHLHTLADLYSQGYALAYEQLFEEGLYGRISLPTYPFARERYWITEAATPPRPADILPQTSLLHPLLHVNISDLTEQCFASTFAGNEFFLVGRAWKGQQSFLEVAYLEMARAALELSLGNREEQQTLLQLQHITWPASGCTEEQPLRMRIGLFPEPGGEISYEISGASAAGESEAVVYSLGSAFLCPQEEVPAYDLTALLAQCNQRTLNTEQCYERFAARGLEYSADLRGLEALHSGQNQMLAALSLPASAGETANSFVLHPALLEAVCQAAAELLTGLPPSGNALFPVSLQTLEIFQPCMPHMWAVLRLSTTHAQTVDIDVCDDQGTVSLRLKGLAMRERSEGQVAFARPAMQSISRPDASALDGLEPMTLQTFEEIWQDQELPPPLGRQLETVICFLSQPGAQQIVFETLRQCAGEHIEVIFVSQGTVYKRHSRHHYTLNRRDGATYQQAFQAIQAENDRIDALLYLWPLEDPTCIQDYSLLFFLLQGMVIARFKPGRFLCVGSPENGLERSYLESWIGIERSLNLILPEVQMAVIFGEGEQGGITALAEWTSRLWKELCTPKAQSVRYQADKRAICAVQPLTMQTGNNVLQAGKTYLITGGGGGLGLLLAEYLARNYPGNVILLGRSALDLARQSRIQTLERLGSQILYLQADVCDPIAMQIALERVRARFGKIHGVIHTAGILSERPFSEKDWQDFQSVLDPKVRGTIVLDEALADEELDFVCYFSSVSAIVGDFGSGDYALGNRFLMAYGRYRDELQQQGQRYGKTVVINWPIWKGGKMGGGDEERTTLYLKASGQRFLETQEGLDMFAQMLAQGSGSRLVLVGQTQRLQRFLSTGMSAPSNATPAVTAAPSSSLRTLGRGRRPEMRGWSVEQCLEWDLRESISRLLQIPVDKLDRDANLTDFGFDSLSLAEFARTLMQAYGIEVTPALFFGYPTLARLVQYFLHEQKDLMDQIYTENAPGKVPARSSEIKPRQKSRKKVRFASREAASHQATPEPIAIIGMSGRFPDSRTIDEFWNILSEGRDVIKEPSENRFAGQQAEQIQWKGGWVPGVREFDPLFFGISPREAEMMDPRQRLLLQHAWNALEDAGYGAEQIANGKIGMFVGVEQGDYQFLTGMNGSITSNHDGVLAARLAYCLNLNGPTMALNTACSSGLVAAHQACLSLRSQECDTAIVGGVNLILYTGTLAAISQAGMLSQDNTCFAFDRRANGLVPGEAVAVVVLKRLSQAIADNDPIYAVIRGSGINYDGKTNGITAPSGVAQSALLATIYERHRINPEEIEYIVTHGTGTRLGDPVEINALSDTFKKYTRKQGYCALTSVKTNIGHTFAASGLVNLICLVQALRHETIPASLHCEEVNEYITWKESPFYVNKTAKPWPEQAGGRRVGAVSAFGMSGTNAHMVVESYSPEQQTEVPAERSPYLLLTLSARSEESLRERIKDLLAVFQKESITRREIALTCSTLTMGRQHFNYRCALIIQDKEDAIFALQQAEKQGKLPNLFQGTVPRDFSGQKALQHYIQDAVTRPGKNGKNALEVLQALADLYCQGYEIPWSQLNGTDRPGRIHLPVYPFLRGEYWTREAPLMGSVTLAQQIASPVQVVPETAPQPASPEQRVTLLQPTREPVSMTEVHALEKPARIVLASLASGPVTRSEPAIPLPSAGRLEMVASSSQKKAGAGVSASSLEGLQEELTLSLAEALAMERREIESDANFIDLGLDSIIGVEWIRWINTTYATSLTASAIYDHPTLRMLAEFLYAEQSGSRENARSLSQDPPMIATLQELILQVQEGAVPVEQADQLFQQFYATSPTAQK